jgi:hypothetical protein
MHRFGALLGLVSLNVSMLLLGSVLLEAARGVGVLALLSGIVGLVALVLFMLDDPVRMYLKERSRAKSPATVLRRPRAS